MSDEERVKALLRPWLGQALLNCCDVAQRTADVLFSFDDTKDDLAQLSETLDEMLFRTVHDLTRGQMRVQLDDGRRMRVYVDDFAVMADELMYLQLQRWVRSAFNCQRLRYFAMTHDSLSALRALYVDFAAFQTPDERAFIARTVREGHAPFRWRSWLDEPSGSA